MSARLDLQQTINRIVRRWYYLTLFRIDWRRGERLFAAHRRRLPIWERTGIL